MIDAPWAGVPARLRWFKRRWICRTTWNTVWSHIKPCRQAASDGPARFAGVQVLGVDEHVWHHQDRRRRGPRELTGIVDHSRGGSSHGPLEWTWSQAGLAPCIRTGWPSAANSFAPVSRSRRRIPSRDSKNAIDDQLQDATSVLDAFHIVKLAGDATGEVRRRVQQDTLGHCGRKGDPLYQIRLLLRASHTQAHPTPTRTTP